MAINIKDDQTQKLVRELAELTGSTMTAVVREAVREKLSRERQVNERPGPPKSRYERLMEFARQYAALENSPIHSWEIDGLLYDGDGLPK